MATQSTSLNVSPYLFGTGEGALHERIVLATDPATGLRTIIALASTARGPAFGGCRYWTYASDLDAFVDALRLSQGMAYKNALADLPFGGGKAVILKDGAPCDRTQLFEAFGRVVQSLDGQYITAEDVGTTVDDMRAAQTATSFISGLPRDGRFGGNPSPMTAYGVFMGIQAAVGVVLDRSDMRGLTVAVQGLGAVGWALCEYLAEAGAVLVVADIDTDKAFNACKTFNARVVSADVITMVKAHVFAPCALGAVITSAVASRCDFRIIAGGANNQLSVLEAGDILHQRGIYYVPDFLINAGGIISCAREYLGEGDEMSVLGEVARIHKRVLQLEQRVAASGTAPARAAINWAQEELAFDQLNTRAVR
ncbi:Leu/Phe/Val dehydrogenase [Burkholderia territorii]|uniref:Leu/Phe/Val dehydrogenase n=1 Tax=Burkholderia territorii TaxID=1503055 RepID=UPI0009BF24F2|nr:Glu/Leu/Phe/Val dehydrogenase dimerization domain-containing protein [Burkholderia territorii]